ncbi:MAG: hypothetical protein ACFE0J_17050 [Elainellaceae cyanobacterium]
MYSNLRDRPKRYVRFMSAVILLLMPMAPAAVADEGVCLADLESRIEAIATRPAFDRARWGILVQTVSSAPTYRRAIKSKRCMPEMLISFLFLPRMPSY